MRYVVKLLLLGFITIGIPLYGQTPDPDEEKNQPAEITSEAEAVIKLDSLLAPAVWGMASEQMETDFKKKGFAWLDPATKQRAIIRPGWAYLREEEKSSSGNTSFVNLKSMQQKLELFGRPAQEVTLEFAGSKLSNISLSIWNKGDARQGITENLFKELITKSVASIDSSLSSRGRDLGKDTSGAIRLSRWRWETPSTLAQLEYSSSKNEDRSFQAEFLRIRMMPKGTSTTLARNGAAGARPLNSNFVGNIKRSDTGDVYIANVPMVDQGQKGYCAVASTERVMRYYGLQIDQHELANAAATTGARGTKPSEFEDALHGMQAKLRIRVRDLISFDEREFEKLVQSYNKEAKKLGGRSWAKGDYYFEANPEILREARCRNGAYEKFRGFITAATDRGMPLLWALHLGRYPETGRENMQVGGGHMRTIIGYNSKTDEVLFSDSWGAGHELKRMKGRDACAATLGLYHIEPGIR
jgi:hypothetical protein